MHRRVTNAATLAIAAALAAGLLGGCASATSRSAQPSSAGQGQTRAAVRAANLARMTPEQKRSLIASDFPIEVPVPAGSVTRGESQGGSVWDYRIEVPDEPRAVAAWFAEAYGHAEWQIAPYRRWQATRPGHTSPSRRRTSRRTTAFGSS